MEDLKKYISSTPLRRALYTLLICIGICIVFEMGLLIGHRREDFNYREERVPGGILFLRQMPFFAGARSMPHLLLQGSYGVVGTIASIKSPNIAITSRDNETRIVVITTSTVIETLSGEASSSSLTPGDAVVVVGMPEASGTIEAYMIRVLPPPPSATSSTFY